MKKKVFAVLCCVLCVASLAACGKTKAACPSCGKMVEVDSSIDVKNDIWMCDDCEAEMLSNLNISVSPVSDDPDWLKEAK